MKNLLKLASLAGVCFAMIVFGACAGGGEGGGAYTVTVNGTAYTAAGTAGGRFTVTNGYTYTQSGTSTEWVLYQGSSSSTSTSR